MAACTDVTSSRSRRSSSAARWCQRERPRSTTGFLDRAVSLNGQSHRYQIYAPAAVQRRPAMAVGAAAALEWCSGNRRSPANDTRGLADRFRLRRSEFSGIGVFPQVSPEGSWTQPDEQAVALAALEQTIEEFSIDIERVSIIGYSMGAVGAYRMVSQIAPAVLSAGRDSGPSRSEPEVRGRRSRRAPVRERPGSLRGPCRAAEVDSQRRRTL